MNIVAFDTETRGLDWYDPTHSAFLATTATADGENLYNLSREDETAAFIAELDNADALVAHNMPFDVHQVRATTGYDILNSGAELHDTHILANLTFGKGQGGRASYGLKPLSKAHLGFDADAEEKEMKALAEKSGIKLNTTGGYYAFWQAYPDVLEKYALKDARITYDLFIKLNETLETDPKLQALYEIECQTQPVLIRAEQVGVALDQSAIEQLQQHYKEVEESSARDLQSQLGDINFASSQQLAEALVKAGVPLTARTKKRQCTSNSRMGTRKI